MTKTLSDIVKTNDSITKELIGLDKVNNTSDAEKPISTATALALGYKQSTLISGTNIKSIGGLSILGGGNLILSGDVVTTGSGSTLTLNLAPTGVTPGSYNTVTVDAKGRVITAMNTKTLTTNKAMVMSLIFGY